jgi:polyhydroxybutyrate depolymerase
MLRWLVALAALVASSFPVTAQAPARDETLSVNVGGLNRIAYLHVPANLDTTKEAPLVIGFHGGAGNARGYITQSRLFLQADRVGFIAVCPEGTQLPPSRRLPAGDHRVWNSGPVYAAASRNADDIAFTRGIIAAVAAKYPVDSRRVFATGFSNGAQMCYRLALELSDRIAAIAPMSGGRLAAGERPRRPVPVFHFHGTRDGVYPFEGGLGPHSLGRAPHDPIAAVIAEWVRFNGAKETPKVTTGDGWELRIHEGPAPVQLCIIQGHGHQIAGGLPNRLPQQVLQPKPDTVALALEFFGAHPMTR